MAKVDITKHSLVPKHTLCSERERKALFEKFGLEIESLPRMFMEDPMAQAMKAKEGDVIKIVRKSPTAGEIVFYRRVVNA